MGENSLHVKNNPSLISLVKEILASRAKHLLKWKVMEKREDLVHDTRLLWMGHTRSSLPVFT
jgi:hypothetical protein